MTGYNHPVPVVREGLVTLTIIIYSLHAISAIGGLLSPALILTAFVTGWPSIIAVVLNYLKRDVVHGTYLATHFRWQIRTFWFAVLWIVIAGLIATTVILLPVAILVAWTAGVWVLYRIIRGGLRLLDELPMPVP